MPRPRLRSLLPLPLLLVLLLGAGCSTLATLVKEPDPPTATVGEHHLATMVLPREDLGLLGESLNLAPADSGYVDDARAAYGFPALQLTAADLQGLGRVNGYALSYVNPSARRSSRGVYGANSSVDLFEGAAAAAHFFDRISQELKLSSGTVVHGVRYGEVVSFRVGNLGDKARGYHFEATLEGSRSSYAGSIIVFRYGRLVATTTVSHFGSDDMNAEADDLARALERRIDRSVEGYLIATPVPLVASDEAVDGAAATDY